MRSRYFAAVAALILAVALAACGSSSSSSSSSSSNSSSGSGSSSASASVNPQAAQAVNQARQAPTPLNIPVLPKAPKKGATIVFVSCTSVECAQGDKGFAAATHIIGWNLKIIKSGFSPEQYQAAWSQAIGLNPTAIASLYLAPNTTIQSQLATAKSKHIPVVMGSSPEGVNPAQGVIGDVAGPAFYVKGGAVMADWVAVDSQGKGDVLFLADPATTSVKSTGQGFAQELARVCPGCKTSSLPVSVNNAGTQIPAQVVSELQKNPNLKYVIAASGQYMLGVPQAIKAAGLSVKTGNAIGLPATLAAVKAGTQTMVYMQELSTLAFRIVDLAARAAQGVSIPSSLAAPEGEGQLFDPTNVGSVNLQTPWDIPNVAQTFTKAWHATG